MENLGMNIYGALPQTIPPLEDIKTHRYYLGSDTWNGIPHAIEFTKQDVCISFNDYLYLKNDLQTHVINSFLGLRFYDKRTHFVVFYSFFKDESDLFKCFTF